ncbi:hypothetical protein ACP70R_018379 [Stipagrostis hirtigluma subsp. patula]
MELSRKSFLAAVLLLVLLVAADVGPAVEARMPCEEVKVSDQCDDAVMCAEYCKKAAPYYVSARCSQEAGRVGCMCRPKCF